MTEQEPVWVILPVLVGIELTRAAISDVLAQSVPTRLLLVNQGCPDAMREEFERISEADERVQVWSHMPPLPSLSATWNRALEFVWEAGGDEALVVNNDARFPACTVQVLREALQETGAYFVSAVGVREPDYQPNPPPPDFAQRGGPDFSCFLISKEAHEKYPFDPGFIPSHAEDLDMHRRLMLAGDGPRIFSVNLPYLHYAAQTLKLVDPVTRARLEREIADIARVHYRLKWGGDVNAERFTVPFDPQSARTGVTTPELQAFVQAGGDVCALIGGVEGTAILG